MLLRAGYFAFLLQFCYASLSWSRLDLQYIGPYISQRDISISSSIDQLLYFGVSLNRVIFDTQGYSNLSLLSLQNFLNLKYSLFMLDLYWNHFTQKWQLCPAPFAANQTLDLTQTVNVTWNNVTHLCLPGLTVTDLFQYVNTYLSSTNLRVNANVVQFALNLKSIYIPDQTAPTSSIAPMYSSLTNSSSTNSTASLPTKIPEEYRSYNEAYLALGNSTLRDSIRAIDSYLFTPQDLLLWSSLSTKASTLYPSQNTYLFSLYKRVIPFVLGTELHNSSSGYNISATDKSGIFFQDNINFSPTVVDYGNSSLDETIAQTLNGTGIRDFAQWEKNTHFRIVIDDDNVPFSNASVGNYLKSGYSTILNSTNHSSVADPGQQILDAANRFTPSSFWSWKLGQFYEVDSDNSTALSEKSYANTDGWYVSVTSQTAYLCVSVTKDGWALQNCYDKMRGVCQNNTNPFGWEITPTIGTYLDWSNKLSCSPGFSVGVPHLSVEQFSLISFLAKNNVLFPVWIDFNDITVPNCFVSGGPYALCPYQEALTTRNFIKTLVPSGLVSLFLIFLILCERIVIKTPIHANRKRHWKKRITEYYKENDYEGVPL